MEWEAVPLLELSCIEPLWEKLRAIHTQESPHFKEHFRNFTFQDRCRKFWELSQDQVHVLTLKEGAIQVGYCISTAIDGVGEIDSLYLEESHRGQKLGEEMLRKSLTWLESRNCSKIQVSVAVGHEYVFPFYEKFGFKPRLVYLERPE